MKNFEKFKKKLCKKLHGQEVTYVWEDEHRTELLKEQVIILALPDHPTISVKPLDASNPKKLEKKYRKAKLADMGYDGLYARIYEPDFCCCTFGLSEINLPVLERLAKWDVKTELRFDDMVPACCNSMQAPSCSY